MTRPPVGFIVEGVCEFQSYESIIRKGIVAAHGRIPIANAFGNGSLRKSLEEKLVEIVKAGHPIVVIVTLDVRDAIAEGAYEACAEMRVDIQSRADEWLQRTRAQGSLQPLPERIVVVLQAPTFEAWLTSDASGLSAYGLKRGVEPHRFCDVDSEILQHKKWLEQNIVGGFSKRPPEVHRIAKALHPGRMERCSRSFRKFWKEVRSAYSEWSRVTGGAFVETSGESEAAG